MTRHVSKASFLSIFCLAVGPSFGYQSYQPATRNGITMTTDMDCAVAIDDKIVGRIKEGRQEVFSITNGIHTASAVSKEGDYWERKLNYDSSAGPTIEISFTRAKADRAALERSVSELRGKVVQQQEGLIRKQKEKEIETATLIEARRHSLAEAVNYYSDRWGKEMGLRDSLNERSKNLSDESDTQYWNNLGNPNQTAQGIGNLIVLAEMLQADRLKKKALKNDAAVEAASARMNYLGKALKDPRQYPPDSDEAGYSAIITNVTRNRMRGKLLLAPDRVQYSDPKGKVSMSCSSVRNAGASKELRIGYSEEETKAGKHRRRHRSLAVKPDSKRDAKVLLADLYLACPKLTQ